MNDLVEKTRKKYLKFNLEFKLKVIDQHTVLQKKFYRVVKMENAMKYEKYIYRR